MGDEHELVRLERTHGDQLRVVMGPPDDPMVVDECRTGEAQRLALRLREVLDRCIDLEMKATDERHSRQLDEARRQVEEARNEATTDTYERCVDAVDACIASRIANVSRRPYGTCCRKTANDIRAAIRKTQ